VAVQPRRNIGGDAGNPAEPLCAGRFVLNEAAVLMDVPDGDANTEKGVPRRRYRLWSVTSIPAGKLAPEAYGDR
jgi:hypothetical protein